MLTLAHFLIVHRGPTQKEKKGAVLAILHSVCEGRGHGPKQVLSSGDRLPLFFIKLSFSHICLVSSDK